MATIVSSNDIYTNCELGCNASIMTTWYVNYQFKWLICLAPELLV